MRITFDCSCGKTLSVPEAMAGKRCKCPGCGEAVGVPRAGAGSASAVARTGASGARWREKPVIGIVAVMLILGSGAAILKYGRGHRPNVRAWDMMCNACGYQTRMEVKRAVPLECPKCGRQELYRSMKCGDCGEIFAYAPPRLDQTVDEEGKPIDPKASAFYEKMPACPKCGSTKLTVPTPDASPSDD